MTANTTIEEKWKAIICQPDIPLIDLKRRVMPSIMMRDIVGVSPMTGPGPLYWQTANGVQVLNQMYAYWDKGIDG
jgi:hypothetical protein